MSTDPLTTGPSWADQVAGALAEAVDTARWPDGSLLVDLDATVVRDLLCPQLMTALTQRGLQGSAG